MTGNFELFTFFWDRLLKLALMHVDFFDTFRIQKKYVQAGTLD